MSNTIGKKTNPSSEMKTSSVCSGKASPVKKKAPSNVQQTRSQSGRVDNTKFSQEVGAQAHQTKVPNFQSWASPQAASKSNELKPLSGDTMGRRDKGDNVSQLQSHLNGAGAKLEVDGKFGPQTQKAVRKFQRQHNLTVDGKVGRKPWAL